MTDLCGTMGYASGIKTTKNHQLLTFWKLRQFLSSPLSLRSGQPEVFSTQSLYPQGEAGCLKKGALMINYIFYASGLSFIWYLSYLIGRGSAIHDLYDKRRCKDLEFWLDRYAHDGE